MKHTFLERLADPRPIILDGATGTELERLGVDTSTPIWSAMALLNAPELVEQVHRSYVAAGAEVIITNTFRTHRRNLESIGMGNRAAELTARAVALARRAVNSADHPAWVAGSIAPLEDSYSANALPREVYLAEHAEMAHHLASAGVDLLLIETISTIREAEAAAEAAHALGLPYGVSFICKSEGNMFSGERLADAVAAVLPHKPDFFGVNCTAAPELHRALRELRAATDGARPRPPTRRSMPTTRGYGLRVALAWSAAAAAPAPRTLQPSPIYNRRPDCYRLTITPSRYTRPALRLTTRSSPPRMSTAICCPPCDPSLPSKASAFSTWAAAADASRCC
jgi:homocysteine S-methyltransferase